MSLWGPERAAAACKPRRFFLSLIAGLSYGDPRPSPVRRPRSDPRVRPPPSRSARLNALCLGSRRPRWGEPRLWGAAGRGPYEPSARGSARCSPGWTRRTAAERPNGESRGRGVVSPTPALSGPRPEPRCPSRETGSRPEHLL